ncbi:MAG TPA: hydroxymethylbilane synthase, partial [Clostridia bacterium]|nr:hydroxymethylbilane synthase [Clostridia bacterium]
MPPTITIASRGSALALAQANLILAECRAAFPALQFQIKIIKTTGDKLQTASLAQEGKNLPKGLFTKELEVALLDHEADLAVHSLKDLPTELPVGLRLGAVSRRADVRDVLLYRDERSAAASQPPRSGFPPHMRISDLPSGAVIATSNTRRKAQLLMQHPGLVTPDIRGNVATRMQKLADQPGLDGTILALAGLT